MKETRVQSLGQEDPREKEMVTHFSILAWKSHGQRSLAWQATVHGVTKRVRPDWATKARMHSVPLLHPQYFQALCELVLSTLKSFKTISTWSPQSSRSSVGWALCGLLPSNHPGTLFLCFLCPESSFSLDYSLLLLKSTSSNFLRKGVLEEKL